MLSQRAAAGPISAASSIRAVADSIRAATSPIWATSSPIWANNSTDIYEYLQFSSKSKKYLVSICM